MEVLSEEEENHLLGDDSEVGENINKQETPSQFNLHCCDRLNKHIYIVESR